MSLAMVKVLESGAKAEFQAQVQHQVQAQAQAQEQECLLAQVQERGDPHYSTLSQCTARLRK